MARIWVIIWDVYKHSNDHRKAYPSVWRRWGNPAKQDNLVYMCLHTYRHTQQHNLLYWTSKSMISFQSQNIIRMTMRLTEWVFLFFFYTFILFSSPFPKENVHFSRILQWKKVYWEGKREPLCCLSCRPYSKLLQCRIRVWYGQWHMLKTGNSVHLHSNYSVHSVTYLDLSLTNL